MKKELIIFFGLFLFLAIGMHFKEWISHPIEHFISLSSSGAYGLGAIHPLVFTLILYMFVWLPRFIVKLVSKKNEQ